MTFVIEDVLVRHDPIGPPVPLVVDSPHSGSLYPADFGFRCPLHLLRQAEDAHVADLFSATCEVGGHLIEALFPRSYIDVNRALDDIDPALLSGAWPAPLRPTEKSRSGSGLIRQLCRPGLPIYDGRLSVTQVADRIDHYWRPYHEALVSALDECRQAFGFVWHLNCHSMPARSSPADIVLGDRDGTSCDRDLTETVTGLFVALGYRVALNDPYKGAEIVRRYGVPEAGVHSLQIEINRALYMDEVTLEPSCGFSRLQTDLAQILAELAVRARSPRLPSRQQRAVPHRSLARSALG